MVGLTGVLLRQEFRIGWDFPKQLALLNEEPLIQRTARIATGNLPLIVVLGHKSEECRSAVICRNAGDQQQIGGSKILASGYWRSERRSAPGV